LADFGLAKEANLLGNLTEYVSTRWYRAPEVLLRSKKYHQSIDIFGLGCMMAELFLGRPLASGTSTEDQITKLVTILGSPSDWPEAFSLADKNDFKLSKT
jgi:protein kinase